MNYRKHYDLLINRGQTRLLDCYVERHHIIPRCLGGSNEKDNIVCLTAEEHYVAHQLLVKMFPSNRRIVKAANMMALNPHNRRPNNKIYGWLRKRHSESMIGTTFGKGYKHTDAARQKMSESAVGRQHTRTTKDKISLSSLGRRHTKETKDKLSAKATGRKHSEKTKNKMRASRINQVSISHTDVTKQKMSESTKQYYASISVEDRIKKIPGIRQISVMGVVYPGLAYAGRYFGIGKALVRYRCLSKTDKWKNWFYTN